MLGGAGLVQRILDDAGQLVEFELPITGDVGDGVPTADVQLGQDDAVARARMSAMAAIIRRMASP